MAALTGTASVPAATAVSQQQAAAPLSPSLPPAPLSREITGSGHVIALQSVPVFARYEGRIESVSVTLGSEVRAGDVLAVLAGPAARLRGFQDRETNVIAVAAVGPARAAAVNGPELALTPALIANLNESRDSLLAGRALAEAQGWALGGGGRA
ncbi:biotin/lipoyl-binding protein [Pannonibacter indicus]|uniref:biotin/lipoyl-binding protein n=1 Tax=Pannonibacter indicus TaxID=466044 RepID=UPI00391914CA